MRHTRTHRTPTRSARGRRGIVASLLALSALVAGALALVATSNAGAAAIDVGSVDPGDVAALDARGVTVHCVAEVVGIDAGVLQTTDSCFRSAAEADDLVASIEVRAPEGWPEGWMASQSGSNTIGWHFSDTSYSGSNIRIVGTTCNGGVWPASGFWNNNIESSVHYCGSKTTRFWDYSYCGGSSVAIGGSVGSFGWFNNRTSCVQYGY